MRDNMPRETDRASSQPIGGKTFVLLANERSEILLLLVGQGIIRNKLVVTPWENIKYA